MKRQTTKGGVASGVEQMKTDWIDCWKKFPQKKIQEWIERIPKHVKEIIRCGGGNEYREGSGKRKKNPDRVH
jgi:hypothetical protein